MSAFHECIKQMLADVDIFLHSTLKDETLSKLAQKEKNKLLNSLHKLYEEYEVLNPNLEDGSSTSSKGTLDESRFTSGSVQSHGSHGSEDEVFTDNIPDSTMKGLTNPIKLGYLTKKPTDLLDMFSKQKKYCVIHKNVMYWFKKPADKKQQGAFFLTGYEFKDITVNDKEFVFELASNKKKSFQFQSDNKEELEEWKKAVEAGISFVVPKPPPAAKEEKVEAIEENYDEEYEDIGDIAQAVNSAIKPVMKASAMTATKLPQRPETNSAVKPPLITATKLPLRPEPEEPSSPDSIYEDAMSTNNALNEINAASDDMEEVYECVEPQEPSRTSVPTAPPPLPPKDNSVVPPPLPNRGPTIPAPISAATPPPVKMIYPTLNQFSLTEDYENLFYGVWSCTGSSNTELSFKRGEIIHILNRDLESKNWWIGEHNGSVGLVPKTFLSPAYEMVA